MKVIELARNAKVTPHVVRFYVRKGLLHPERHPYNGYRVFGRNDLEQIRIIRTLQKFGFTLAEIAKVLEDVQKGFSPLTWMTDVVARRVDEVESDMRELQDRRDRMMALLAEWKGGDRQIVGSVHSLDYLANRIGAMNA